MNQADRTALTRDSGFYLEADDLPGIETFLKAKGWISAGQSVLSATTAGAGNMNKVLRVGFNNGDSAILKQARPWVEKFPEIPAPVERATIEALYFSRTATAPAVAAASPQLLNSDAKAHVLMVEDLGESADLSVLYEPGVTVNADVLSALTYYLSDLHRSFRRDAVDFNISNLAMRELNAEHIFSFPFADNNGLDLDAITPGLGALATEIKSDKGLLQRIQKLGRRYLSDGPVLLHGDFYPGSFLDTASGVKVIDPEFCFFGDAEFDIGVFRAHLLMGQQPNTLIEQALRRYRRQADFSDTLCDKYTGVEILRRLLGLAQLPLHLNLAEKQRLLTLARTMLAA